MNKTFREDFVNSGATDSEIEFIDIDLLEMKVGPQFNSSIRV